MNRYVLKCIAIKDSVTFQFKKGDIFYFHKEANEMKCVHYKQNPYKNLVSFYYASIPFTKDIDKAKVWQKPAYAEDLIHDIEKVGHFKCQITKVKLIEINNE